jgi:DNA-binding Xre family transcriptional regulator
MARSRKKTDRPVAEKVRHPGGRPRVHASCEIGTRIERLAESAGLHLDQVAAEAGIAFQSLHDIRTGKTKRPSVPTLVGIARALRVPLDDLIRGIY